MPSSSNLSLNGFPLMFIYQLIMLVNWDQKLQRQNKVNKFNQILIIKQQRMRLRVKTEERKSQENGFNSNQLKVREKDDRMVRYRAKSQFQQKIGTIKKKQVSESKPLHSITAGLIQKKNFEHLDQLAFISNQCDCGRHLSKFSIVKPNLTKLTIYKRHYKKQRRIQNKISVAKEYERFNDGPHLDMCTTYHDRFKGRGGDQLEKPHPKDSLGIEGPSQQLSTYATQFPGHHGANQYIKPTDKHSITYHPLRCKTTYNSQYQRPQFKKDDYKYIADQLKTGTDWFGKSTYEANFPAPDQDYFAKKVKITQRLQKNPNYNKQFQTVYQHQFKTKEVVLCPAKVYLQTAGNNKFDKSKKYLTENGDFKAYSPQFHAISNSKHYYV